MKSVLGRGFQGEVIGRDGKFMIIKCDYSMKGVRIGDPCRIDPYKFENSQERRNWMSDERIKRIKRRKIEKNREKLEKIEKIDRPAECPYCGGEWKMLWRKPYYRATHYCRTLEVDIVTGEYHDKEKLIARLNRREGQ